MPIPKPMKITKMSAIVRSPVELESPLREEASTGVGVGVSGVVVETEVGWVV